MMTRSRTIAWFVAAAVLTGCDDSAPPLEPGDGLVAAKAAQAPAIDVGGAWTVETENFIHLDEFGAQLFGFVPEGKRTTIRCTGSVLMTLQQDGASFGGSFLSQGSVCESTGGQSVTYPPGASADDVVDGDIRGNSIHFTLVDQLLVECPARGTITGVDGGTATGLRGNFHCFEPGHPKWVWPAPPPRAGPNRTIWEAYRQ
jgi:hypothetical protein